MLDPNSKGFRDLAFDIVIAVVLVLVVLAALQVHGCVSIVAGAENYDASGWRSVEKPMPDAAHNKTTTLGLFGCGPFGCRASPPRRPAGNANAQPYRAAPVAQGGPGAYSPPNYARLQNALSTTDARVEQLSAQLAAVGRDVQAHTSALGSVGSIVGQLEKRFDDASLAAEGVLAEVYDTQQQLQQLQTDATPAAASQTAAADPLPAWLLAIAAAAATGAGLPPAAVAGVRMLLGLVRRPRRRRRRPQIPYTGEAGDRQAPAQPFRTSTARAA